MRGGDGYIVLLVALLLSLVSANQMVDLTGPGCDKIDGYSITGADETLTVESIPRYNSMATRDHCDVTIRAPDTRRRLQYMISQIKFDECGIEILIYDTTGPTNVPKHLIRCGSETEVPISGTTRYNVMRINVRQTTPQSRHYEFKMQLRNDLGPPLEYLEDEAGYQGESLQTGVIVGLVIAAVIIIIALILLAIYLCVRARQATLKENAAGSHNGDNSVYTSGTSQAIFPSHGQPLSKRPGYGSFEDVRSTSSSQANGTYANPAYTKGPGEKRSERSSSVGRARGKAGFANDAFDDEDGYGRDDYWEEGEAARGSLRKARRDVFDMPVKGELKSAMKKPTEIEMSKVSTQPVGILKHKTRNRSDNRSTAGSSTDGSTVDANALVRGYKDSGIDHPNVKKSLGMPQRRPRSRSGGRSHHSSSSAGHGSQRGRRSHSADKKQPKDTGRMYTGAFIDDSSNRRSSGRRPRSNSSGGRSRARSDRTSDSIDSASTSTTNSRRVSMNPGGRRVHIKGEETDI